MICLRRRLSSKIYLESSKTKPINVVRRPRIRTPSTNRNCISVALYSGSSVPLFRRNMNSVLVIPVGIRSIPHAMSDFIEFLRRAAVEMPRNETVTRRLILTGNLPQTPRVRVNKQMVSLNSVGRRGAKTEVIFFMTLCLCASVAQLARRHLNQSKIRNKTPMLPIAICSKLH